MVRYARWRRGVNQQRTHDQSIACLRFADDGNAARYLRLDRSLPQLASTMRCRENPQSAVFSRTIVKVETHGNHLFQDSRRRLHMHDTRFDRPRTIAFGLFLICNRDGYILMPRHLPVGAARLVEENPADYEGILAKDLPNESQQRSRFGELPEGSNIEEIADAASAFFGDRISCGQLLQTIERGRPEEPLLEVEAALVELSTIDVFAWQAWPFFC